MTLIREAADGSYPPSLNNLGVIHLRKEEYGKAVELFRRAAELVYTPALFNLGARYARGEGVEKSYEKAVELYRQAAYKGDVDAQYSLGLMYSQDIGVETTLKDAFTCLLHKVPPHTCVHCTKYGSFRPKQRVAHIHCQ